LLGALALLLFCGEAFFPVGAALADSIRGLFDFTYNSVEMESLDMVSAQRTETDSSGFRQQYNLSLDKSFFPNLRLSAGGIFEKYDQDTSMGGQEYTSQRTNTRPYADLTLDNRLFRAGLGYSKREEERKSFGFPARGNINERHNALFGWKPEGLPSLDLRLDKSDLYDRTRQIQDSSLTSTTLNSSYVGEKFTIQYNPGLSELVNRIDDYEMQSVNHNGRFSYSDSFFNKRTRFGATYNVSDRQQRISAHGAGELAEQLGQVSGGLFLESDILDLVELDSLSALVDGQSSAISSVNIGTAASQVAKQLGIDFGTDTEVNALRILVDKELPPELADFFVWDIFVSDDNSSWQFARTVTGAEFDPFANYFQLDFPGLMARQIKVVVRPLRVNSMPPESADPQYANIQVTELQAFVRTPLADGETKNSSTSHQLNMDARTRLMERYALTHTASFFMTKTDPGLGERATLSNALSASHRFTEILTGSARLQREDITDPRDSGVAHGYSLSLRAEPLPTLRHTLVVSGRQAELGDEETTRNSVALQNRAELYRGIDVFLNGSAGLQTQGNGREQESVSLNMGADLVPHRSMTITANRSETNSDYSGGGLPEGSRKNSRSGLGLTWRPFQTLYLVASYGVVEQERRNDTLINYSLSWSPFPYGTLQLLLDYSEELRSEDQEKVTTFRPGLRWEIAPRINLTLAYYISESDSIFQTSEMETLSANLKIVY